MLNPYLWRPAPKISRIRERRNRQRGNRRRGQWRDEQGVLACDERGLVPIKSNRASPQAHDPERNSVGRFRESSRKIKLDVRARARSSDGRAKSLNPELRLSK